jgi:hypothetical protein
LKIVLGSGQLVQVKHG